MTQPWPPSEAYGLYLKWVLASTHQAPFWIVDPSNHRTGAKVSSRSTLNGSVPLWKRRARGVACLAQAPDREGHELEGLGRCVPWDNTGPLKRARECSVQV
jgi:hypothetical protein